MSPKTSKKDLTAQKVYVLKYFVLVTLIFKHGKLYVRTHI